MKLTALLPMKDHSERIPSKNIRTFAGLPLYHWIISSLLTSEYINEIIVNTDSNRLKDDIHSNFPDVRVIWRPKELQGDMIPMNLIIQHDMNLIQGDYFLQTHATNPLLPTDTIDKAISFFLKHHDIYDSLFSVTRIQSRLYLESGKPVNHDSKFLLRTQDLLPVFEENSNIYLFSKNSFDNAGGNRIGLQPYMFVIDKLEAIDIDEEEDWCIAEAIQKLKKSGNCI